MHSSRMRTGRSLTVCRSLLPGGGGGVCSRGICPQGVCLLQGGGVCAPGVSALGRWVGICSRGGVCSGGVCSGGGGVSASVHAGIPHPPCEQNEKQVQKYYLGHNFVAAGKNEVFTRKIMLLINITNQTKRFPQNSRDF